MTVDKIDLSELALERSASTPMLRSRSRISLFSKWLVPVLVIAGFSAVLYWAVLPGLMTGIKVTAVKVRVDQGVTSAAGTPLFRASGWVEPRPTPVYVSSLITGTVKSLLVVEDQDVNEGECVATLVDDDAKLALREARAEVLNKEGMLKQAQFRLAAAQIDFDQPVVKQVAVARAEQSLAAINTSLSELPEQIVQAQATLVFSSEDLESKSQAGTAVSRIEIDEANAVHKSAVAKLRELQLRQQGLTKQLETATALLDSMRLDLELNNDATNELGQAKAAEQIARAELERAEVHVEEAELELARTKIISPVNGKVMRLMTSPGGHLSGGPGSQGHHVGGVAVMLYDPASLQVRVDVRFEDVRRVSLGQQVLIESPGLEEALEGVVLRLNPVADIQKNTLEVKVSVAGVHPTLKPEMLMNVTFLAPADDDEAESQKATSGSAVFVPDSLVIREDQSTYVWVVDGVTQTALKQTIVVDSQVLGGWVEVLEGLNLSSQLIKSSSEPLLPGAKISVTEYVQE